MSNKYLLVAFLCYYISFNLEGQSRGFLQNKIYIKQNTYTMLDIIDDNQVEYIGVTNKGGEISKDSFPLPISVKAVMGGKVGYTIIENKILCSFFSWYNRFPPQIVAVDIPNSKIISELNYKPVAPYAASLSRLNSRPLSRSFQSASTKKKTLQVDYGTDAKKFIYLVFKLDGDMSIWRYEEDFLVFDNPEMPLRESGTKMGENIFHNKEIPFTDFISFVLKDELYIATDEDKIYKYSEGKLIDVGLLPFPYEDCLFIIDKDQDKLLYVTREEFSNAATIVELEMKEIKLSQDTVLGSLNYLICEKIYAQTNNEQSLLDAEDYPLFVSNILEAESFLERVISRKEVSAIDEIIAFKPIYNDFLMRAFGIEGDKKLINTPPEEVFKFNFIMSYSIFSLEMENIANKKVRFEKAIDFYNESLLTGEGYWQAADRYIRKNAILLKPFILESLSDWDFSKHKSNTPYSTFLFASEQFDKREVHQRLVTRLPEFVNLSEVNDYSVVIIPKYLDFTEPNIISDLINLFESINEEEKKIAILKTYNNLPLAFEKSDYAVSKINSYTIASDNTQIKKLLQALIE